MNSLMEYAAKVTPPRTKCKTCALDPAIVKEINDALGEGLPPIVVSRWLFDEHSIEIDRKSIGHHKTETHAKRYQGWKPRS